MSTLIQLLLENIYIVIIAAGFILSLLNKARKSNPRGYQMPDFSGGARRTQAPASNRQDEPDYQDWEEEEWEENSASPPVPPAVRPQEPRTSPFRSDTLLQATAVPSSSASRGVPVKAQQPAAEAPASSFRMPEGDELRKAIILAEVLGPPRSKRPLRRG